MTTRSFVTVLVALLLVLLASASVFIVDERERAVLLRFGALQQADIPAGLHFKLPLADEVKRFDGRVLTLDSNAETFFTVDKSPLVVDSFIKWRIADVNQYYRATAGDEQVAAARLEARANTGLRAEISRRDVHDVVSGERDQLMADLTRALDGAMQAEFGVRVLDVRVKRIELPQDVSSRVYQRMETEREVLARELRARGREEALRIRANADREVVVIRANAERESEQIRGDGDAAAAGIYAAAYNRDPEFYAFYRSLDAYRAAFASKDDVLVIDPSSDFFRYLGDLQGGEN